MHGHDESHKLLDARVDRTSLFHLHKCKNAGLRVHPSLICIWWIRLVEAGCQLSVPTLRTEYIIYNVESMQLDTEVKGLKSACLNTSVKWQADRLG